MLVAPHDPSIQMEIMIRRSYLSNANSIQHKKIAFHNQKQFIDCVKYIASILFCVWIVFSAMYQYWWVRSAISLRVAKAVYEQVLTCVVVTKTASRRS